MIGQVYHFVLLELLVVGEEEDSGFASAGEMCSFVVRKNESHVDNDLWAEENLKDVDDIPGMNLKVNMMMMTRRRTNPEAVTLLDYHGEREHPFPVGEHQGYY